MQWPSLLRRRGSVGLRGVSFPSGRLSAAGTSNRRRLFTATSIILESVEWVITTGISKHEEASLGFGPVDVVIIGFPGNKFSGQIAPARIASRSRPGPFG